MRVPPFSAQAIVTLLILLVCGGLVLYPVVFLAEEALNVGDPQEFPLQEWGLGNFAALGEDWHILANTGLVACLATVMAVTFGFVVAWILTRTRVPGGARLERLMELPYYMTPLVGALAWAILASPRTGGLNQLWHAVGGGGDLFDIYSPFGIAWVMALFEGTVAFVMISAAMKSMDPSLEETSRVLGAGKFRTVLKITLPLVMPGVLGATIFVFAEMLGSFAAAYVLGIPGRYYVITTAIWQATTFLSAGLRPRRGDGDLAVRGDARDPDDLSADRAARQLRDDHRQGVPAAGDGYGARPPGYCWRCAGPTSWSRSYCR